jgi:hypothetical protein
MASTRILVAVFVLCGFIPASGYAAELTGRIWSTTNTNAPPANTKVSIVCDDQSRSVNLAADGSFTIRNLPSNKSCRLTVSIGASSSQAISISTRSALVRFNAAVQKAGNKVLVLPR